MIMSNAILGCIVFLISNASLLYASHLLIRRFYSDAPPAARLVASGTAFYAFVVLVFQGLSPFHAITKTGVTLSCFSLALIFHLVWGKHRDFGAEWAPVSAWTRDGLSSRWSVLIIAGGFVLLLSLSRALLMPPMAWDCLTYHLTFAAFWVQKGSLLRFIAPDQIAENVYLPINGEIFSSWLMLPFHSDLLANTVNFPITLLGGISCYAIARELGLTRKEASFAPALVCFAPVIYAQITTAYVDNAVFAFCVAAVLFALRYLRSAQSADAALAFAAAGILIGIKYSGIPVAGLVVSAIVIKRVRASFNAGRVCGMLFMALLILSSLGGRQYFLNALDARNPLYPVPIKLLNFVVAEGSSKLQAVDAWADRYEASKGLDRLRFWEREYKKLLYLPRSAGPKFLFFLLVTLPGPFLRPRHISRSQWYFLMLSWVMPTVLFYTNNSADYIRKAFWIEGSTRFLSPFIALLTIQALLLIRRFSPGFGRFSFLFAVLIVWDLFNANLSLPGEAENIYPLLIVLAGLVMIFLTFLPAAGRRPIVFPRWLVYAFLSAIFVGGCYVLQNFRDGTRYAYYRQHYDYFSIPKIVTLVNGWEFLDHPDQGKTVALSVGWDPPGHIWFFYPLMGRQLQNEVLYISSKYRHDPPAWLHKNMLRGDDAGLWLTNLREKAVDYIVVATPWPTELAWMEKNRDLFQLIFSDQECKIFKYKGRGA